MIGSFRLTQIGEFQPTRIGAFRPTQFGEFRPTRTVVTLLEHLDGNLGGRICGVGIV